MKRPGAPRLRTLAAVLGEDGERIRVPAKAVAAGCPVICPSGAHAQAQALVEIEAALGRLDSGHYGLCLTCGGQIGFARLDVDPVQAFCARCEIH